MIRKFTNIVCVYYNDKNYIPAKYNCPDLEIDDYAFALFCNKSDLKDFAQDHKKYKRQNWKLLDFREIIKTTEITNKQKDSK